MVVVRKYAGEWYDNTGVWQNPQNMDNGAAEPDALCGRKVTAGVGTYDCYLKTYGFAIPSGSTINSIKIGFKACYVNVQGLAYFYFKHVHGGYSGEQAVTSSWLGLLCTSCNWNEETLIATLKNHVTADDLNSENFTTRVSLVVSALTSGAYVDCCYIEVDYTLPSVSAGVSASNPFSMLAMIASAWWRRRKRRKRIGVLVSKPIKA